MQIRDTVMNKLKLTSVNVDRKNHKQFKILCIKEDITFQKLVNISLEKYIKDKDYRKSINECK